LEVGLLLFLIWTIIPVIIRLFLINPIWAGIIFPSLLKGPFPPGLFPLIGPIGGGRNSGPP